MKDFKWMIKAMLLGLTFFIAALLVKPIGVSTQFSVASGIIHSTIDSDVITENPERKSGYESTNAYYDKSEGKLAESIKNPMNYDFIFVFAIPLGAFIGYQFLKKKNQQSIEAEAELAASMEDMPKEGFIKKYLPGFISGFLILFGARMADGCTSGHMMSGIMQGSVSGLIFAAAVFAVAIPVAMGLPKKLFKGGLR